MISLERPFAYAQTHRERFVAELQNFVRFPSVSAQPQHSEDIRRCADWLAHQLRRAGLECVAVVPTPRHPLVYAEWRHAPGGPTLLIYGHYDVQPPEPLSTWHSPPFMPSIRGNNLYGRGASDAKGPLFAHVKALEAYLHTLGRLPLNVVCLFEGEEEIGSPNLPTFITHNPQHVAADVAVISDTRMLGPHRPTLVYALRGNLALELRLTAFKRDVHSGAFGGATVNPIQTLCEMIACLHDPQGRITIPGFYNRVHRWSDRERAFMRRNGPSDQQIVADAGAAQAWGERGYSLYERTTIRPALTLNGITGGYQGPGGKGIIPARASAKLSIRLVPHQDPHEIERLTRRHLAALTPVGVGAELRTLSATGPALIDRRQPAMQAAVRALQRGFGTAPVLLRSGGSIPVINAFNDLLGTPTVLMGFALPDDRMHAPNEKFYLPNFFNGITTCITFLNEVARTN